MPLHSKFLTYFSGVCQHGSIRKAAKHLHISPTAINRCIINYEEEINLKLFYRVNNGMLLTPAGDILYGHICRTLGDAQNTLNELTELSKGEATQIKVGGAESIIAAYLPAVMLNFFKSNPQASTSFTLCTTEQAIDRLNNSVIDIAVIFDPDRSSGINIIYQQELTIGAVLLPEHPLAKQKSIQIEECVNYPIIMPEKSWTLRKRLDKLFEEVGKPINIVMESGSTEILQSMVSSRVGVGFHTIIGIERSVESGQLVFIPLFAPDQKFQKLALCIHPHKRISAVLKNMIDLLVEDLKIYQGR